MTAVGSATTLVEVGRPVADPVTMPMNAARRTAQTEERLRGLVAEHIDFVWRLLCRLGVPEADADDATQQVFIVATRRIDAIVHGSERTFLYGTALHVAATLRRGERRRSRWIEAASADCASPAGTPHDALERRQALAVLDELLARLGHELRLVFVLCELEELAAPEVAAMLGIPAGTVASRLRRAREKFRAEILRMRGQKLSKR